jgi:hypothetical protein
MENMTLDKKTKEHQSQVRKPFWKPRLQIYGHISAITQTSMTPMASDGGTASGFRKTAG